MTRVDFRELAARETGATWSSLTEAEQRARIRAAKRSWLGEPEPQASAPPSYPDWLAVQPPDVQDRALGPHRAAKFRAGELPITRFTDPPLPPMSLEQLAATVGLTVPNDIEPGENDR